MNSRSLSLLLLSLLNPGSAAAGARTYALEPAQSRVVIRVGKSGLFGFAGHEHEVVTGSLDGRVLADPEDLARSSVSITFDAAALRVTGEGEPAKDVPKVQEVMLGPKCLDVARFPTIAFVSTGVAGRQVSPGVYQLQITGDFTLHGVTRSLSLALRVEALEGRLTATGKTVLRQSDFAISPVSVAGVVKVKNELTIEWNLVGGAA